MNQSFFSIDFWYNFTKGIAFCQYEFGKKNMLRNSYSKYILIH